MRKYCPIERLGLIAAVSVLVAGCQQADQTLPFELDGQGATLTIGTNGGTISVPPSFSLAFPAGALAGSTSVTVAPLLDAPFPAEAGIPVPGSAYDVTTDPSWATLLMPVRVDIRVDSDLLEPGDDVRMSVAVMRQDGSVVTFGGTYDVTNGILSADIDELGPIAAVISADAIALEFGTVPTLLGGSFPPPPPPPALTGASLASHGGLQFSAVCAPETRQCFTSGMIRVWADAIVRERLGDDLFLLNPSVDTNFDFLTFDQFGVPTSVAGSIFIDGELRARLNSAVTSYDIEDGVTTGPTTLPAPTTVQISGSVMIIGQTTATDEVVEFDEEVEFGITGIGTSEMLTIRLEADVEFDNDDGSITKGEIIAHIRLRR